MFTIVVGALVIAYGGGLGYLKGRVRRIDPRRRSPFFGFDDFAVVKRHLSRAESAEERAEASRLLTAMYATVIGGPCLILGITLLFMLHDLIRWLWEQ